MKKLRPNQLIAFKYTMAHRHPALFLEMRLGKCIVTIRRCNLYAPIDPALGLKILIVCPPSAIGGWVDELTAEGQDFVVLEGYSKQKRQKLLEEDHTYYVANNQAYIPLPTLSSRWNWDAVVIDECNSLSNVSSGFSKYFLNRFRDCPHRWALTGTPIPENKLQLWGIFGWLHGHAFGYRSFWNFRAKECSLQGYDYVLNGDTSRLLVQELNRLACIQTREEFGLEPNKDLQRRSITMPYEIRRIYDNLEQNFEMPGVSTIWETEKYIWLRKLCGGYHEGQGKMIWHAKANEIEDLLKNQLKDQQVVIWFHFNHELYAIADLLDSLGISNIRMTGAIPRQEREERRRSFMLGYKQVALVQQAIAQTGMDLSAASTAIYYSETPSCLASKQTADRIVNISKPQSLLYIYLTVENSIDSDLHATLKGKFWKADMPLNAALKLAMKERLNARVPEKT